MVQEPSGAEAGRLEGLLHSGLDVDRIQVVGVTVTTDQAGGDIISGLNSVVIQTTHIVSTVGTSNTGVCASASTRKVNTSRSGRMGLVVGVNSSNSSGQTSSTVVVVVMVVVVDTGGGSVMDMVMLVLVVQGLGGSSDKASSTMSSAGRGNVPTRGDSSSGRVDCSWSSAGNGANICIGGVAGASGIVGVSTRGSMGVGASGIVGVGASGIMGMSAGSIVVMVMVLGMMVIGVVLASELSDDGGGLLLDGIDSRKLVGRDVVVVGRGGGVVGHVG